MLPDDNVLLILAVILVVGTVFGALSKLLHLPSVTGQIFAGILIGPAAIGLLAESSVHTVEPMIDFALGLMGVAVGSHLNFRRLTVARHRLAMLLLLEATLTPLLVFFSVMLSSEIEWYMALLLATIAVSTAPATVLALVKETRSKGAFVTTLLAAVALDNLACIILFEIARTIARSAVEAKVPSIFTSLLTPGLQVILSVALGFAVGVLLTIATRRVVRTDRLSAMSLIAILLTTGISTYFGLSMLLACLSLGISLANLTPNREEIGHRVFESFESAIFAVFFTVAGLELKFDALAVGGVLAIVTFLARFGGKVAAGYFAMRWAGATPRFRRWLGVSLIPQAGLAVGLMLLVAEDEAFSHIRELFLAVVLTMVFLNETVGPVLTRLGLSRSGDFGRDRARVLDFLSEHNITTALRGPSKREAVRQLVELTVRSHKLQMSADEVFEAVMKNEEFASTCVGEGLALPHARLDIGSTIIGAMGINREGLDLDAPDSLPVHCMVLIITPTNMPERHLEVLSALASSIGRDRTIQQQLYHIDTPAHADELLHLDEQFADWNYFTEDPE